jgi:hypothetical protein
MKMKSILSGSIALSAVCIFAAAGYSQSPPTTEITAGRAQALVAVAIGLITVIIGGLALYRAARRIGNRGRAGAIVALVLGPIDVVLSAVHIAGSTGFGTGGGRAGAIVALGLSLVGIILGGLALARSRRSGGTE